MKRHQDQPDKNPSDKHEEDTNNSNNPIDPGSQHVERDRNSKDDQETKRTSNERSGHNKRIRPLL